MQSFARFVETAEKSLTPVVSTIAASKMIERRVSGSSRTWLNGQDEGAKRTSLKGRPKVSEWVKSSHSTAMPAEGELRRSSLLPKPRLEMPQEICQKIERALPRFRQWPSICASEKYADAFSRNSQHINEMRLRTFVPAVHSSGEKWPKRRQKGL